MPRTPSPTLLIGLLALAALARPAAAFTPDEAKMPMTVTLVRSDAASCGADCPGRAREPNLPGAPPHVRQRGAPAVRHRRRYASATTADAADPMPRRPPGAQP